MEATALKSSSPFPTLRRGSENDDIFGDGPDTDSCSGPYIRVPFRRIERIEGIFAW